MQIREAGKLNAGDICAVDIVSTASKRLFYRTEDGIKFLVDTGAEISVLAATVKDKRNHHSPSSPNISLVAANNTRIKVFGTRIMTFLIRPGVKITWEFIIADVDRNIIGADLLHKYQLIVDIHNKCLITSDLQNKIKCSIISTISTGLRSESVEHIQQDEIKNLFREFPQLTRIKGYVAKPAHGVFHQIITNSHPVSSRFRRLAPDKYQQAKEIFDHMLDSGLVKRSNSSWSSPLHLQPKPNTNESRPCGDYRALNSVTVPDKYPLPYLHDFSQRLHGCNVFSKIDLVKAFHHIRIHPDDVQKTAITTPFGLFEFTRMPFGLRNAPQTFQRFMDMTLQGLPFVFCYIDDILVASENFDQHVQHLREVFTRLDKNGLTINAAKCSFAQPEMEFLGHSVNSEGIRPTAHRVQGIADAIVPTTVKQLRRFLGMVNFYHRFIEHAAEVLSPLYDLLKTKDKKLNHWPPEAQQAFDRIKATLTQRTLLHHYREGAIISLSTDASSVSLGAVLHQHVNGQRVPIAFASRKLIKAEQNYPTFDRELLAIYWAILRFRYLVEGRQFCVYTDHRPLESAFRSKAADRSPRQINHLSLISEFTTDIRYVKGEENVVADCLSRWEIASIEEVTAERLAQLQEADDELRQLMEGARLNRNTLKFDQIENLLDSTSLVYELSTGKARCYIPSSVRRIVFRKVHELSHPGIRATLKLVSNRYFWPAMNTDVREWTRACHQCQLNKINRHTKTPIGNFVPPNKRFQHVHIDIVGPLPLCREQKYVLTMIDRFSRWVQAVPMENMEAETVALSFMSGWISTFGCPARITTDRGTQFESRLFQQLMALLGTHRWRTSAYNPKANGMIERVHRQMKAALRSHEQSDWVAALPIVLLGMHTAIKEDSGYAPCEILFGEGLPLPGDVFEAHQSPTNEHEFVTSLRQFAQSLVVAPPRTAESTIFVPQELETCTHVYIRVDRARVGLQSPYEGPFPVLSRDSKKMIVRTQTGEETIPYDRLRPAFRIATDPEEEQPQPAARRGRGRPRKEPVVEDSPPPAKRGPGRPKKVTFRTGGEV